MIYPEHIRQASLLSILHCSAASARSSARRLASSYEISSSSDGPGDSVLGAVAPAAGPDLDTETEGEGTGTDEAVVAICTRFKGVTSASASAAEAGAGAGSLAAAAFALASVICQEWPT